MATNETSKYTIPIRRIGELIKKKKTTQAKALLFKVVEDITKPESLNELMIFPDSQVTCLDQAYKSMYVNGAAFNNYKEWHLVCAMGYILFKKEKFDCATAYFEEWCNLLIRYMKKNQSPPDHPSFPSDLMLYFENVNGVIGLENIGQILQFSSQRTSEIHALFISMKADLLAKMGKTKRATKAYQKAVTILEKKTRLEFAMRYVENIRRLTKLHMILNNVDEALKCHIKIFKELNPLIKTTKTPVTISFALWCYLDISSCLLEHYGDDVNAQLFLVKVHERKWLQYLPNLIAEQLKSNFEQLLKRCHEKLIIPEPQDSIDAILSRKTAITKLSEKNDINIEFESIGKLNCEIELVHRLQHVTVETKVDLYLSLLGGIYHCYVNKLKMPMEAVEIYKSIRPRIPPYMKKSDFYTGLAKVYSEAKLFRKALRFIRKANKKDEDYGLPFIYQIPKESILERHLIEGRCYYGLQKFEEAIVSFQKAAVDVTTLPEEDQWKRNELTWFAQHARFQEACKGLAKCYWKLNKYNEAERWIQKAPHKTFFVSVLKYIGELQRRQNSVSVDIIKDVAKFHHIWKRENWLWYLMLALEDIGQYFLHFRALYEAALTYWTKIETENAGREFDWGSRRRYLDKHEVESKFNLSRNSLLLKECFKNKIATAKNQQ